MMFYDIGYQEDIKEKLDSATTMSDLEKIIQELQKRVFYVEKNLAGIHQVEIRLLENRYIKVKKENIKLKSKKNKKRGP